jgi:cell division protease FtsH
MGQSKRKINSSGGIPLISASFARWQACGHLGEMLRAMTDTFAEAIAAAPCVLFIDEIDAAGSRDSGERQNGSYRRQVVNGFLEQIDIAMRAEGVLIVGACNNVSALDPAILRLGRFDSLVELPLPGRDELTTMLMHLKWSCFLGQFCGLSKMHLVCVHAAFCISAWPKYAMSGVRLSRAV